MHIASIWRWGSARTARCARPHEKRVNVMDLQQIYTGSNPSIQSKHYGMTLARLGHACGKCILLYKRAHTHTALHCTALTHGLCGDSALFVWKGSQGNAQSLAQGWVLMRKMDFRSAAFTSPSHALAMPMDQTYSKARWEWQMEKIYNDFSEIEGSTPMCGGKSSVAYFVWSQLVNQ